MGSASSGKKIVFVTKANHKQGLGHLMRCKVVSRFFARHGWKSLFAMEIDDDIHPLVEKDSLNICPPEVEEISKCLSSASRWLLWVDQGKTEEAWMERWRSLQIPMIDVEDAGPGRFLSHLLIDAQRSDEEGEEEIEHGVLPLFGYPYCILSPSYRRRSKFLRRIHPKARRLFFCFGGSDPEDLTGFCLSACSSLGRGYRLRAALGPVYPNWDQLNKILIGSRRDFDILSGYENLASELYHCDIAVLSAGILSLEAASLGTPMILLSQNRHQIANAVRLENACHIIHLGMKENIREGDVLEAIHFLAKKYKRRARMAIDLRRTVQPLGMTHIWDVLREKGWV